MGNEKKARAIFVRFAKWTGNDELVRKYQEIQFDIPKTDKGETTRPYKELLGYFVASKRNFIEAVLVGIIWFSNTLCHYGAKFVVSKIPGKTYIHEFIGITTSIIIFLTIYPLFKKMPRKKLAYVAYPWVIFWHLVMTTIPETETWAFFVIPTLTKFGAKAHFLVIYVQTNELYPTEVRGLAFGIANSIGRLGAIAAVLFNSFDYVTYYITTSSFLLLALLCTIPLRETKGKMLADRINEDLKEDEDVTKENVRRSMARQSARD